MEFGDYISTISLILGFSITIISLSITIRHFRLSRTASYIERINTPEIARVRAKIDQWLDSDKTDREKLNILYSHRELELSLVMFLNIITELAISYKYRVVSRKMTREIWNPLIPKYWDRLQFYVYGDRLKGVQTGFYFEYLTKEIESHNDRRKKQIFDRYKVPDFYFFNGEQRLTENLRLVEQGGADQPATASEMESQCDSKPQPESEVRSQ